MYFYVVTYIGITNLMINAANIGSFNIKSKKRINSDYYQRFGRLNLVDNIFTCNEVKYDFTTLINQVKYIFIILAWPKK